MRALRGLYRGLEAVNGADSGIDPVAFLVPFTPRGAGDEQAPDRAVCAAQGRRGSAGGGGLGGAGCPGAGGCPGGGAGWACAIAALPSKPAPASIIVRNVFFTTTSPSSAAPDRRGRFSYLPTRVNARRS